VNGIGLAVVIVSACKDRDDLLGLRTEPRSQVIKGVGFFQFVASNWKHPLGSLECHLKKELPGPGFLIVLPEAFNFGADYNGEVRTPRIPAERALRRLAHLSRKYGIVFVTGLLHAVERFKSAYIIDADLGTPPWRLLCHKQSADHSDGKGQYERCTDEPTSWGNPSHCKGVYVGALICNDAHRSVAMENALKECSGTTLLCIPAWMNSDAFPDDNPRPFVAGPYRVWRTPTRAGPLASLLTAKAGGFH
jgi:hypothetical protein